MITTGCERAELQKSSPIDNEKITSRGDDCTDCPVEDCCCFVELVAGSSATLIFCGTSGPEVSTQSCDFDVDGCPTTSGYSFTTMLDDTNDPSEFFCMQKNTAFRIAIANGSATLNVTCQYGQMNPQVLNFSLSSIAGPNRRYFTVDGDCELTECP